MSKFHINPETGNASACRASGDGCPFGGNDQHYSSQQEAQGAYEETMEAQQGAVSTMSVSKKRKSLNELDADEKLDLARDTDDAETLELLAEESVRENDEDTLAVIVENPHTSTELINRIAGDLSEYECHDAQVALAKNPRLTEGNLIHLAEAPSWQVHEAIVDNPNVTTKALDVLAEQYESVESRGHYDRIRWSITQHEKTSARALALIEENENEED